MSQAKEPLEALKVQTPFALPGRSSLAKKKEKEKQQKYKRNKEKEKGDEERVEERKGVFLFEEREERRETKHRKTTGDGKDQQL